jgi:integrase
MSVRKRQWTTSAGVEREAWVVDYVDQQGVRRLKTFARKKDADAAEAATKVEVKAGIHVADGATVTVAEAGEQWIKTGEAEALERTTLNQRRQHLDLHIKPFLGRTRLSRLGVPAIRTFQDKLREEGRSTTMIKIVTGSLGGLIADAQERGLVARNAVREMARGRLRGKERRAQQRRKKQLQVGVDIPTPDEISRIVEQLQGKGRWRPLIITAILTGLRASELRGLRWADVDLKGGKVHVRQRADRFNKFGAPKSNAGKRSIPIGAMVVNTLRLWKLECPKSEGDLVFPNAEGNVEWHANIVNRGLIPPQIAAGIVRVSDVKDDEGNAIVVAKYPGLHALRHFFASWCINRQKDGGLELSPKMVQERLGHSTIAMTMDTYGHLFPTSDEAEALATAEQRLLRVVDAT